MTIDYTTTDETGTHIEGTWTGAADAAIAAAVSALQADEDRHGRGYVYRETCGTLYRVDSDDLARLGAALLDGHTLDRTYSVWCSAS